MQRTAIEGMIDGESKDGAVMRWTRRRENRMRLTEWMRKLIPS